MSFNKKSFFYAQCGCVLLVLIALILLPGASMVPTLLAIVGVWGVVSMCYKMLPWKCNAGWWTLLISSTILAIGVIANVNYYTIHSGATTQMPVLHNPDAWRYYADALSAIGHESGVPCEIKSHGYGLIISWLWQLTGVTIVAPLMLNMLMVLLAVIVSGGIAWRLLNGTTSKSGQWVASCAMIMTASVCYFLNSGTLLLKEAGVILAFALLGYSLITLTEEGVEKKTKYINILVFTVGALLLAMLRYNFLIMPLIGMLILLRWNKGNIITAVVMAVVCVASWLLISALLYSNYDEMPHIASQIVKGEGLQTAFFLDNPDHRTYNAIVEGYFDFPWWKKVLMLPMSAAVQYLIPLPWGWGDDVQFGYSLAYAHISYPWYAVGGLVIYFIISQMRKAPRELSRFVAWGGLMWLVPAFLFAGTVSRYALPMLSLLIPGAVYVVARWCQMPRIKLWVTCYLALLAIGLVAGYVVQKGLIL